LALYIAAILCFSAALLAVLIVFRRNQRHIEDIVAKRITGTDPTLERLDLFAFISFGIGALLTALVGIGAAIHSFSEKEQNMSDKQKSAQSVPTFDSVNGAARLQPTVRIEKSFSGAAALQPAASQPTTPAPAAQANTPAAQAQAPSPPPANSK
jgi:hypothetical protein